MKGLEIMRYPSITVKTVSCGPFDPEGHDLVLKLSYEGGVAAHLHGREVPQGAPRGKSIRKRRLNMCAEWYFDIMRELRYASLSAAPVLETGFDGGFVELKVGDDNGHACFRWWEDAPREWATVGGIARQMIAAYERFAGSGEPPDNDVLHYVSSTPVVGMCYVPGIDGLLGGVIERGEVRLVRECDNPHDGNAIAVHLPAADGDGNGARIGYVPRRLNAPIARMMDEGVRFTAEVLKCESGNRPMMELELFAELPRALQKISNGDAPSGGGAKPEKDLEEILAESEEGGEDSICQELSPGSVRRDILRRLEGNEVVVHTNAEDDEWYRELEDGCYTVEVKNPNAGGESLYLEFAGEFTIFFGGWHSHYPASAADYMDDFVEDVRAILSDEMCVLVAYDREGSYCASSYAVPPLSREEGALGALRCLSLPREHLQELRKGGVVKVRFWSPGRNFDLPVE